MPENLPTPDVAAAETNKQKPGEAATSKAKPAGAKGHYVKQRVFFADEATAIAAGYRPCANCLPEEYAAWRASARPPRREIRA